MAEQRELDSVPGLGGLYVKAAAGSTVKPVLKRVPFLGGRFGGGEPKLPDAELVLPDAEIDRDHLARYDRVCGFRVSDELPPTYPHLLAFPLAMQLMTANEFPFAVIGLVHIRNRIEQARPIRDDERLTVRVRTANLGPHPKGTQFEIHAEAEVDGAPVWRSLSTYLRKGGGDGDGAAEKEAGAREREEEREGPEDPNAVWEIPDDIGRRYAAVSGDSNPIHLRRSTALVFGMPRPIAHGMWTKARCLAALEGLLPDKLAVDVAFKVPVFLPSKVAFASWVEDDGARAFMLKSAKDGKPHLSGTVEPQ
jgi:acyl dehydratase